MKVLVVDDEQMILSLVTKILQRQGHTVTTAFSGEEGLRAQARQSDGIDLMILDLAMPGLSGVETLRRARQADPDLPCIISSGQNADWRDIPQELMTNLHFLQKPYRAEELADLVNGILVKEPI